MSTVFNSCFRWAAATGEIPKVLVASSAMTRSTGRPRTAGNSPTGQGTRADILYAGARLFCSVGYGSTSTHALAEAAGIRQASLYHYFRGKNEILLELLVGTVRPSVEAAAFLLNRPEPAADRLWALCASDVSLLTAGEVNLGSLYLLPELTDDTFAPFHDLRSALEDAYRALIAQCLEVAGRAPEADASQAAPLVLGLVESIILQRRRAPSSIDTGTSPAIADAALRILALPPETVRAGAQGGTALLPLLPLTQTLQ